MSDFFTLGVIFAVVVCFMLCFVLYNIYRGVHDSLANAVIDNVYNFRYFQPVTGDYERFLARIVDVRKLSNGEINRLNSNSKYRRYDEDFMRSHTLVTCEMPNGNYRQFYAERSDMCRRSAIGGLLFRYGYAHLF